MMKKKICLTLATLLLACAFAGSAFASNIFKTSISPYSWFRYASSDRDDKTDTSDYGVGIQFGYLHVLDNGLAMGAQVGIFDYYLASEEDVENDPRDWINKNGNCVVCPIYARVGYYTPKIKEKTFKFFVLADVGGRLLHVTYSKNFNFGFGAEIGVNLDVGKGFSVGVSAEPHISFSDKTLSGSANSNNVNYTDFIVTGSVGLTYEW